MRSDSRPFFGLGRHRIGIDGKGVTTLCAFHGCPLRCKYCINPQGLDDKTDCTLYTPEQLYQRTKVDELYFLATGGGVTFGGGEPLLHTDFIEKFRALCGPDWRLCAESSLYVPKENIASAAKCIDDFIVDIKDTDPKIYQSYTGKDNNLPLSNLRYLLSTVGSERILVRLPRIPHFNDDNARQKSKALLLQMGLTNFDLFDYTIR